MYTQYTVTGVCHLFLLCTRCIFLQIEVSRQHWVVRWWLTFLAIKCFWLFSLWDLSSLSGDRTWPWLWQHWVLTSGLPGTSQQSSLFKWRDVYCFLKQNVLVHWIDCSVLLCTLYFCVHCETTKIVCDSLYCHILFIMVVWKQTSDISRVRLY